jgi:hypothetical protein
MRIKGKELTEGVAVARPVWKMQSSNEASIPACHECNPGITHPTAFLCVETFFA